MRTAKIILTWPEESQIGFINWTVKGQTDYELWHQVVHSTLVKMGIVSPQMTMGFFLDLLNSSPVPLRKALISGIAEGRGLVITEEEGKLVGNFEPRYEPLFEAKSGLWTPS